jgi:hypothetical protein
MTAALCAVGSPRPRPWATRHGHGAGLVTLLRHRSPRADGHGADAGRAVDSALPGRARTGRARTEQAATATSKSAVSRRFVAATETALAELRVADLSSLDSVVSMVDGVHFGERCCVVVLGIDIDGVKHPASLVEGSTKNATPVTELLVGWARSGCQPSDPDRARRVQSAASRDTRRIRSPRDRQMPATQTERCPRSAATEAAFGGGQADARGLSRPDRAGRPNEAGKQFRRSTATYIYGHREPLLSNGMSRPKMPEPASTPATQPDAHRAAAENLRSSGTSSPSRPRRTGARARTRRSLIHHPPQLSSMSISSPISCLLRHPPTNRGS